MSTRRYSENDIKTRGVSIFWDQFAGEFRMLCKRCPAYSGRESLLGFLRELREPVTMMFKGEIQIGKTVSMRVPMHITGTELLVVVMKCL
jgi:hypothetical protein